MPSDHLKPREGLISEGDHAPDFTLSDQNRENWTLTDALKEGDVVLCFFPFAFTGVCATEMECISREISRYTDQGATAVGISCDSFAALKAWADQGGYTHTLLSDIHRDVCRAYGLYWKDMNVAQRGTVIVTRDDAGKPVVKWSQAREPGNGMDQDEVLAALA